MVMEVRCVSGTTWTVNIVRVGLDTKRRSLSDHYDKNGKQLDRCKRELFQTANGSFFDFHFFLFLLQILSSVLSFFPLRSDISYPFRKSFRHRRQDFCNHRHLVKELGSISN